MLEIRGITKIYRSKTGEDVKALDNVSIQFPESGMVFILGKSGSGKSTLLNVMGGLDSYDSGEFIIKGKSSKDFGGSDFDAYRNTFIGFIFQEYNVLDDFTVGANIGLALELQGKKATDEAVNGILSQVDLLGFAKRKPNELSGGQKQRVAIARALVKEPEIIMADEPTGALDSNTGKQIFDTLKELSKTKLVLIVSHDRDFAERYADRIVELADGRIIEDVTKHERKAEQISDGVHRINDNILRIEKGYRLSARDLEMINAYLAKSQGDVLLSGDGRVNEELRSAAGISKDGATNVFEDTDPARDVKTKQYEKGKTSFIRSRLPMKNAVKMGSSGLKHKKFRLFMTILLSFISFAMFGLASTVAAYENISSATASIMDSNVRNASVTVGVRHSTLYENGEQYHWYNEAGINEEDIKYLNEQTGLNFVPVYTGSPYAYGGGFQLSNQMITAPNNQVFTGKLTGFVNLSQDEMNKTGFRVVGRLPVADDEIAITELMYRQFKEYGFQNNSVTPSQSVKAGDLTMNGDGSANDILGKTISFSFHNHMLGKMTALDMTIVGVVDTEFDYVRYDKFLPQDETQQGQQEDSVFDMVLMNEIEYELNYGFHALGFATKGAISTISSASPSQYVEIGTYMSGWSSELLLALSSTLSEGSEKGDYMGNLATINKVVGSDDMTSLGNVVFFDGRTDGKLKENEILISSYYKDVLIPSSMKVVLSEAQIQALSEIYGEESWNATDAAQSFLNRLYMAKCMTYVDAQLQDPAVETVVRNDAQNNGFGDNPRDYWLNELRNQTGYMPYVEGLEIKTQYELRQEMYEEVWAALVKDLYGFDDSFDSFTAEEKGTFVNVLEHFYAEAPEYTLQKYEIADMLRNVLISKEYQSKKALFLADGSKMIDLLIESGRSDIQSLAAWEALEDQDKDWAMQSFYYSYVYEEYAKYYDLIYYPVYTAEGLQEEAANYLMNMSGLTEQELLDALTVQLKEHKYENGTALAVPGMDLSVAGFFENSVQSNVFVSDVVRAYYDQWYSEMVKAEGGEARVEDVATHADGIWAFAIAPMPKDQSIVAKLASLHYAEEGLELDLKFRMRSSVMSTLDTFDSIIEIISQVFVWVGLALAVFSSFLLMNFISTSISYKKREIGILRAVGARSSDVFKIFFSEAFIIAVINFILATAASLVTVSALNSYMRGQGINITLLRFGLAQMAMMFAISVFVAALASFMPVYRIAHKKPVDAIKDL